MATFANHHAPFPDLQPGDTIAVRFGGVLSHYGIVTQRRTVISNSRKGGGVTEQSLSEFAAGRPIRLCESKPGLEAIAVEHRARRALGADYDLMASNCSHFTRWTHRRRPTALQTVSAVFGALKDLSNNRRRY